MFPNKTRDRPRSPRCILLGVTSLLLVAVLAGGCGIEVKIPGLEDTTTKTVNALDDAIDKLTNASADWQVVLQDTIAKLTEDAQSTVRSEVSNTLNRAVATTSSEFRCDVDFLRARIRQDLLRIKARLLKVSYEPVEPSLCTVVPPAVDMSLEPNRRNLVTFFGYDFDTVPVQVQLIETNRTLDQSDKLTRQTHYHMTLNLGGNGVPLSASSQKLVLRWQGREISTIPIIQPTTPVCRSRTDRISDSSVVTFVPPHTRGDRDFVGNGPRVTASVQLLNRSSAVIANIWMTASETKDDWTTASGWMSRGIYTAPAGWSVRQIVGTTVSSRSYTDSNTNIDAFNEGAGGPVKRFEFVGDTPGDEAGTRTSVKVVFNPVQLELVETRNCVPQAAVTSMQSASQLAPSTLQRLQSTGVITP